MTDLQMFMTCLTVFGCTCVVCAAWVRRGRGY